MRKYCLCQREHVKYEFLVESLRQLRREAASQCDPPSITKQSNKFGVSDLVLLIAPSRCLQLGWKRTGFNIKLDEVAAGGEPNEVVCSSAGWALASSPHAHMGVLC